MREARLVGLSPDGRFLVVATANGEELAVAADDRLRAAMRGDRSRLGQLEIEMDSALSPREIQSRIRSGESLEEVGRVAGIPLDRVERFAAPVLAERDHIARMAMASSVRRRGETATHRNLQVALTERLRGRGVDVDTVDWNSHRLEDGRWAVTADYRSGEAHRQAEFFFDVPGRFSVAANDDARWILGEHSPAKGPQPGRRRPSGEPEDGEDTEPTLDLSDELALVRVVQDDPAPPATAGQARSTAADEGVDPSDPPLASVQELHPSEPVASPDGAAEASGTAGDADDASDAGGAERPSKPVKPVEPAKPAKPPKPTELDKLYGMLGDGDPENQAREYRGLSDATAVPDTVAGGWEPAIVVSYPVEPSLADDQPAEGADADVPGPDASQDPALSPAPGSRRARVRRPRRSGTDAPGPPERIVSAEDRQDEADAFAEEHGGVDLEPAVRSTASDLSSAPVVTEPPPDSAPPEAPTSEPQTPQAPTPEPQTPEPQTPEPQTPEPPATQEPPAPKPVRRKRASVPSWDEIVFGGPRSSS
jgi:hypothetical protein